MKDTASLRVTCDQYVESFSVVGFLNGIITINQQLPKILTMPYVGEKLVPSGHRTNDEYVNRKLFKALIAGLNLED